MKVLSRQRNTSLGCPLGCTAVIRVIVRRHARGFTLVELMITLAVAAILLVIAVPSFQNMIASNRLITTANELVGAINVARMEAIKRNNSTQFCSNTTANNTGDTLGAACSAITPSSGAVVVQTGGNPATVQVRAGAAGLTLPVQLHGDIVAIRFNGQGLGYQAGTTSAPFDSTSTGTPVADICTPPISSSNNHVVINMTAGSIITTTPSKGACP